ncbi:MAG: class I SAM-dependent methyltransferase [Rhodobacterales bacterium]|nr:class I SAM-dependent methyltransferase [Rhodobacterales bacterium]MDX5391787.1 class I SAM-dependent methyltransferase [Rhodobacterales bacterium]MDX5491487.1 class I SAM-dependent methyltransferase [Rhodobacterales bacterium]
MLSERLSLALAGGDLSLPDGGTIAVFGPRAGTDLSSLPAERVTVITGFKPDHDAFAAAGYLCEREAKEPCAVALVCLPRAKAQGRALLAQAADLVGPGGLMIVDGQKTDGIESMLRDLRAQGLSPMVLSKAHGKLLWFAARPMPDDWHARGPQPAEGGYLTAEGVFSADGVDPASRLLAESLPEKIGARVVDLGAGWGYLAARILARDTVRSIDLVEADHTALECARANISDPRARFHWADATTWRPESPVDAVVMNPPFHTGRAADPDLGRAFIAAAAAMLAPQGRLWLVANRHLPYETALAQHFAEVIELDGDNRFKILAAARPTAPRSRQRH